MITTEHEIYFTRTQCEHSALKAGEPPPEISGRLQRVTKLMALAIRFNQLQKTGVVKDQSKLARLGHVAPARLSQIINLLTLSPEIPEAILFLPRVHEGLDSVNCAGCEELGLECAAGDVGRDAHLNSLNDIANESVSRDQPEPIYPLGVGRQPFVSNGAQSTPDLGCVTAACTLIRGACCPKRRRLRVLTIEPFLPAE